MAFYQGHRETIHARTRVLTDSSLRGTRTGYSSAGGATAVVNTEPEERVGIARIVAADLYPDSEALSPALLSALTLLGQAIRLTVEAIQLVREDSIAADLNIQSLRPVLRKVFMCRQVGDGFAALVDALISALDNNHGMPLSDISIVVIQNALLKLRDEPFLSFTASIRIVEEIEHAGFSTEPPGFEHLADWLTV